MRLVHWLMTACLGLGLLIVSWLLWNAQAKLRNFDHYYSQVEERVNERMRPKHGIAPYPGVAVEGYGSEKNEIWPVGNYVGLQGQTFWTPVRLDISKGRFGDEVQTPQKRAHAVVKDIAEKVGTSMSGSPVLGVLSLDSEDSAYAVVRSAFGSIVVFGALVGEDKLDVTIFHLFPGKPEGF